MRSTTSRLVAGGLALTLFVGVAACSSDGSSSSAGTAKKSTTTEQAQSGSNTAALEPTGSGCAAVPASGAGSFAGMAQDPAATAASNNPALSTLVEAVKAAGLVDTLNGTGPFTVFAPANSAFEKIPAGTLSSVLADKATLTKILTLHVISGSKMSLADLEKAGSATTVEGEELTFGSDGGTLTVDGAKAVCMDVPTANATVHIIDSVLMPEA